MKYILSKKKKSGRFFICMSAFLLLFLSDVTAGTNWETISEDDSTVIYIDNDTIRHASETVVAAMFKIAYKEPFWVQSKSIRYYVIEEEHNCEENTYTVHQLLVYFNDGTNTHFDTKEEMAVKPDTFQSVTHYFICRKKR
jgi:hypothetical protein